MPVFYTNQIDQGQALFQEEESRHIIRVNRLARGDALEWVDGKGNYYQGVITDPDPKACRAGIQTTIPNHLQRDYHLHIAIAPPKSTERFEWFLEKSTEIGVDEITPILCERSERTRIRYERSMKILISAMKQCGRALLPTLNTEIPINNFLDQARADIKLIAHCDISVDQRILDKPQSGLSWIILIGPEGDFTPDEIQASLQKGYSEMNLGEAVYRTETAGIVACHTVSMLYHNKS